MPTSYSSPHHQVSPSTRSLGPDLEGKSTLGSNHLESRAYGRALVVGAATTHGKGSVQQVMELGPVLRRGYYPPATERTASLKITTQQFYRVAGSFTRGL